MTKKILILTLSLLTITLVSKAQVELISSGTGSAYTLTVPGVFSLRNGIQVTFKAHANSSAAATINVSGSGALSIMKEGGSNALTAGDIKTGQIVTIAYDGSKWQMMNPIATAPAVPTNYWSPSGSDIYNNNGGAVLVDGANFDGAYKVSFGKNASSVERVLSLTNQNNFVGGGTSFGFRSNFGGTLWDQALISGITGAASASGDLAFSVMQNRVATTMIEAMRIQGSNGYVGIGTSSPAQKLEIQDGHILLSNSGTQSELRFKEASANGANIISFKAPAALGSNINYTFPMTVGAANEVLTNDGTGTLSWTSVSSLANAWSLNGNAGTISGTNFIGTTNAQDFDIRTNNVIRTRITQKGQIEILNTGASVFIGEGAGASDDLSSNQNTFVGYVAGDATTTGDWNTALGYDALGSNVTGTSNTAIGRVALGYNTGSNNTATGTYSLFWGTSGSQNTGIGTYAGQTITTGSNNTFLGYGADATVNNLTNATAIGANTVVSQSNSLILGNAASVGIGTSTPQNKLHVNGAATTTYTQMTNNATGQTSTDGLTMGLNGAGAGFISYWEPNDLKIQTNAINALWIASNGFVGVGTAAAPSTNLHVQGNARVTGLVGPGTVIADASGNLSVAAGGTITGGGTTNYVAKWTPTGVELGTSLIYDNTSVVGIGTGASPSSSRLHVHSTSGAGNLRLTSAATLQSATDGFSMSNDGSNLMYMTQHENADWYFNTNGSTLGIMIKPTGNVGIGTATVNNKLDVEGAAVIGVNYSGTNTAPGNGLLVEGSVAIGTTSTSAKAAIYGANDPLLLLDGPAGAQTPLVFATAGVNKWAWYAPSGGADLTLWHYAAPAQNYINFDGTNGHVNIAPTAGNVGVGVVTTPINKLDVEGAVAIGSTFSGTNTAPTNGLLVEGNMGIGTPSPGTYGLYSAVGTSTNKKTLTLSAFGTSFVDNAPAVLEIRGGTNTVGAEVGVIDFINTSNGSINYNFARISAHREDVNATYGSLRFFTRLGATMTEAMIIDENSNVGIGTSTPLFPLHVETSTQDRGVYVYNTKNTTNNTFAVYGGAHGTGSGEKRGGSFEAINGTGTNIGLRAMASGGATNWAAYFALGDVYVNDNIGIGITPSYKLHVEDLSTTNVALITNTTTTGGVGIRADINLNNATSASTRTAVYGTAWYGTGTNRAGYFYGYGGTTAYGIYATVGGATTNYAGYFSGDVYTSGSYLPSDEKLKNNIVDYNGALSNVMQLAIKSYNYNQEGDFKKMNLPKGEQVGLIASNMKQLFPSLVKNNSFDFNEYDEKGMPVENATPRIFEFDVVNYAGLVPVLVKAIQEQQEMINNLKKEVDSLKNK